MPKSKQNLAREILTVALLLAAVAASEYWFFQLWRLDWSVPMLYGGDGIYWVGQVQRSYGELSGSLGWPFYEVAGKYDPNYDLIYDIFVWFVGLFTKDTGIVFNLYVLVIPFANALAAYAVFRMVGMRRWLSFAFGITFGMTPYVQQRMAGHMMLAACEFVPFSVLLCLWCAEDEGFNRPGNGFFKNKRNWLALAMAWGIANNGAAYYPYFTCFFLCVTALCLILLRPQVERGCALPGHDRGDRRLDDTRFLPHGAGHPQRPGQHPDQRRLPQPGRRGHLQPAHQQPAVVAQRFRAAKACQLDGPLLPHPGYR